MSSEGGLEMRRQLRQSLHFPIPQPLAVPKEVPRHQLRPSLSFPEPQPFSASIEHTRSPRRETWHPGQPALGYADEFGLMSSRAPSVASTATPPATPRVRAETVPPSTNV
jgi:hypothetical protein